MTEQEEQEQRQQAAQAEQQSDEQPAQTELPPVTKPVLQPPMAAIKVLCRADSLQDTANMLNWALGHRVEVADAAVDSDGKLGCLFVFTDIEYYENDTTLLERLGFDMIGKIKGVVSWEMLLGNQSAAQPGAGKAEAPAAAGLTVQEAELMRMLCALPITISIMPRQGEKYAWKCLQASGKAETFAEALEKSLTHLTRTFQLIRSELMA